MAITMRPQSTSVMASAFRTLTLATGTMAIAATTALAQAEPTAQGKWRIGAAAGVYAPRSAVIVAADSNDTRFGSAPMFSLDVQYVASKYVAIYGDGLVTFPTISLGSSIQPSVVGPSHQVMLIGGTAGVILSTTNWMNGHFQPTLRLGGGFKSYSFDLAGAESQLRPTVDLGLGFRGVGTGPVEVTAEFRYLISSFDQSKLPTRGITPQEQRQNVLSFTVGIAIRP